MNCSLWMRSALVGWCVGLVCLAGCPAPSEDVGTTGPEDRSVATGGSGQAAEETARTAEIAPAAEAEGPQEHVEGGKVALPESPADAAPAITEEVKSAKAVLDELGPAAAYKIQPAGAMTEIVIRDGSALSAENIALFGKLADLEKLQIFNFRELNDEMVSQLTGLNKLTTLALTNSVIGDAAVEMIVKSFPNLTELDLSSNTNMTNGVLKVICELEKLERLMLVQNRFNDLGTSHLAKLSNLRLLDIRGNMEAGDMTMEVVGGLPKLAALKHRSTTVTDYGMEQLAQSQTLDSLLMQDFAVTGQAGQSLAKLGKLAQLEIFRCQGFGSDGVLALKGMGLTRLTLRDLPVVDDSAMEVFTDLPKLERLYLHELASVSDEGLKHLEGLQSLEQLDIWEVPQMSDATVDVIATLPNLKELSIRATGVSDAAVEKLLAMPKLQSLTFKENGMVTAEGLKKLSGKKWAKLDVGVAP